MRELVVIQDAAIAVQDGVIRWVGARRSWTGEAHDTVDCAGRAVVPALVDPHTHAVWAGDRLADFEARVSGVSYQEILAKGGGIRSTVRQTAAATVDELVALAEPRIQALLRSGAATIEVKSGYGFSVEAELRMLEAIAELANRTPVRLIPTLLIHIPPAMREEREPYLQAVRRQLIPEVIRHKLAAAIDIFVEAESWTVAEARTLMRCGLPAKLHTEQFTRIGGLELGVREGALSVDHLEAAVTDQFPALAASGTIATILPGVTLHLGIAAANGRALIDAGAAIAVGTDLNPGSSPLFSTSAALALSVRLNGLTSAEALTASTVNAAAALGLNDCGRIAPGARADFLVLSTKDWRDLPYTLGMSPIDEVWIGGRKEL
jgi:imidazolonepropionase